MSSRRLVFAFYDPHWIRERDSIPLLAQTPVTALEYEDIMQSKLYCPQCYESIIRVPCDESKSNLSNGSEAYFRHVLNDNHPPCNLRSGPVVGRAYATEEEATRAVEDEEFIVLTGFMQERPENNPRADWDGEEDPAETHFEDANGRPVNLPVARHNGQEFRLPSKISSVQALVVNFLKNYYREIILVKDDNTVSRFIFCDALKDVNFINDEVNSPLFYFGVITKVDVWASHNTIWLRINNRNNLQDFRVKVKNEVATDRGWTEERIVGRIIVFYSTIRSVGTGYWTPTDLCWGEVAVLPRKYNEFILNTHKSI
ncbi:hypothetical protein [Pectobacterium peruviense]|uniref:Uncharacterized protein n=1 Tax=Pectobacterium peruviense TaxID=2066479 RepID=A0ABX4SC40_9GAMM|nr:hypothetical protein [Pectobacterium peruviense]KML66443.1 hypothetical protein G033_13200 [Pectobacterium peruviense]PKX87611.1 hypothetical protein A0G03_05465 [Pectobacterium peruviense]